jgi:hypothetical protein
MCKLKEELDMATKRYFLVESDTTYESIFVRELERGTYDAQRDGYPYFKTDGGLRFNHVDASKLFGKLRSVLLTKADMDKDVKPMELVAPKPGEFADAGQLIDRLGGAVEKALAANSKEK